MNEIYRRIRNTWQQHKNIGALKPVYLVLSIHIKRDYYALLKHQCLWGLKPYNKNIF